MDRRFLFTRFIHYCGHNGIINAFRRVLQKIGEAISWKSDILFFADLLRLRNEECIPPPNFSIEHLRCEAEVSRQDLTVLFEHISEKIFRYHMEERFGKGALLWLVKVDGVLTGYIWTIVGVTIRPHYFLLTNSDVHLFDNFIFEEFRGRGINPIFVNYVLIKLKKKCLVRAFIEANMTNISEIRSLEKTAFQRYALARKCNIGKRNFTIWSKAK